MAAKIVDGTEHPHALFVLTAEEIIRKILHDNPPLLRALESRAESIRTHQVPLYTEWRGIELRCMDHEPGTEYWNRYQMYIAIEVNPHTGKPFPNAKYGIVIMRNRGGWLRKRLYDLKDLPDNLPRKYKQTLEEDLSNLQDVESAQKYILAILGIKS